MDNLILVESPTKARTLAKFLGSDYRIEATMGHVRDLPKKELGVDVKHNFDPVYEISKDKIQLAETLKKLAHEAKNLILATDPDREGEAIAWHVVELIKPKSKPHVQSIRLARITFHEITESAIKEALKHPKEIDMNLVDAQQARRVLDRLVGYKLSPLLWRKVRRGMSAGRVQSVTLRLVVERDREIEKFIPKEYWELEAELQKKESVSFKAKLLSKNNEKIAVNNKDESDKILQDLTNGSWTVFEVNKKEIIKSPYPPFMTSTMQQVAGNRFGWSAKRTMQVAQSLYEQGYISYHRTDSLNLNPDSVKKARDYILKTFGAKYLPELPRFYKTKSRVAQEAHEAIRPTSFGNLETKKKEILDSLGREASKLYDLIFKRMVAAQTNDAVYNQTICDISVKDYIFRANGLQIKFEGWKIVYGIIKNNNDEYGQNETGSTNESFEGTILPEMTKGEILALVQLLPSQHFTQPPAKYTEASLVKALEEKGIGRPSTYAPTISTIIERRYVEKIDKKFTASALGKAVNDFLVENFPNIVDYSFTAKMEDDLDAIANGEIKWVPVIKEFYTPFAKHLIEVSENAKRVKIEAEMTDEKCDLCGANLVIRIGKFGRFLACSRFPDCKFTKPYLLTTGLTCPKCSGNVIIRRTKRGKQFYGCSNYPKCDFASWTKPILPQQPS